MYKNFQVSNKDKYRLYVLLYKFNPKFKIIRNAKAILIG